MLHEHTSDGLICQHHSTPLQLERVFYMLQNRQIHQDSKYAIQTQEPLTLRWKSYQVPSQTWVMIQKMRRMTVCVILFRYNQYQSFHLFGVLILIKQEPCFVPASILKGLVCHVFIWRVLLNYVMRLLYLVPTLQNFLDLHTMTLLSIGGAATCIMPTDLQHHRTLLRNITCWQWIQLKVPKWDAMYHSSWKYMMHNKICLQ